MRRPGARGSAGCPRRARACRRRGPRRGRTATARRRRRRAAAAGRQPRRGHRGSRARPARGRPTSARARSRAGGRGAPRAASAGARRLAAVSSSRSCSAQAIVVGHAGIAGRQLVTAGSVASQPGAAGGRVVHARGGRRGDVAPGGRRSGSSAAVRRRRPAVGGLGAGRARSPSRGSLLRIMRAYARSRPAANPIGEIAQRCPPSRGGRARARSRRRASCRPRAGARDRALDRGGERLDGRRARPSGGDSPKPGRSTAITSCSRASSGTTGSQTSRSSPIPCSRTIGGPLPVRVWASIARQPRGLARRGGFG